MRSSTCCTVSDDPCIFFRNTVIDFTTRVESIQFNSDSSAISAASRWNTAMTVFSKELYQIANLHVIQFQV